ncbi:MAG TPA: hypothetical protein VND23_03425 [Acidimicrobiales bacterium]|nr:hypothetical protein [Acidimicrobiales bacterium]
MTLADTAVASITSRFASEGMREYLGEPVTEGQHMLLAASLEHFRPLLARLAPRDS